MIAPMLSFGCRTAGAVQAPLTAAVVRQMGHYRNVDSRMLSVPKVVGLQRFHRARTAAAADGVAMSSSWAPDRSTEIRELRSLNDWIANCARSWQNLTAYEGYAAIRKLVEVWCDRV